MNIHQKILTVVNKAMMKIFPEILLFLWSVSDLSMAENVTVNIPYGPIIGSLRQTSSGSTPYFSFQGIPFAAPPVESLRLLPTQPPKPWTMPLDLTSDSDIMCPQLSETVSGDLLGQEDCLYMNIYTPATMDGKIQTDASLPVMVWIYGGGFVTGSARKVDYGPDLWLDQGIVVVAMNYRLYSLGFLSLGIPEAPGNQGLLDQLEALKLVQSSIALFGGDPNQVTLAGQSAGSGSALYHFMSPRSEGLFQRIIAQSGSNFSPSLYSITPSDAVRFGVEAGIAMGCIIGGDSPHARLDCLQGLSLERFVRLSSVIGINLKPNEDYDYAAEPFMPMSPMEALRSGNYLKDVTVMVGTNEDDGLILTTPLVTDPSFYTLYRYLWSVIAPGILFHIPVTSSSFEASRKASELADFYIGGSSNIVPENFDIITDMFTDAFVTYPVECFARYAHRNQNVYQYRYVHQGQYGLNPDADIPKLGVNHADELYLQWDPIYTNHHELNENDQAMSKILIDVWSSFIKTGTPQGPENVLWTPISDEKSEYLVLNLTSRMERSSDYQTKMEFWNELFPC